jgi:hypothetical protein
LAQPREIKSKRKGKDQWRYEIYHSPPGATKARRGKMTKRQNQLDKQTISMTTTCCWAFGALFLSAVCGRKFVAYRKK